MTARRAQRALCECGRETWRGNDRDPRPFPCHRCRLEAMLRDAPGLDHQLTTDGVKCQSCGEVTTFPPRADGRPMPDSVWGWAKTNHRCA